MLFDHICNITSVTCQWRWTLPPKPRFTADVVLQATLNVVRRSGLAAVSARTVAKELGASTAPVIAAFSSMTALQDAALDRIVQLLLQAVDDDTQATQHDVDVADPLLHAAFGFVRFTADEPRFYEALFLHPHATPPDWVELRRAFSRGLGRAPRYQGLAPRQMDALAWRASVVTHGICIEVWSGRWTRTDDRALQRLVDDLVDPVIAAHLRA